MPEQIMAGSLLLVIVCVILGICGYIDEYFGKDDEKEVN